MEKLRFLTDLLLPKKQQEAQTRGDPIRAFWQEVEALGQEQALVLPEEERRALRGHHDQLLDSYSRQLEVDTTAMQKQLSLGMRPFIVSFGGTEAFNS